MFSGTQKSVLLKESSGERCVPRNSVHLIVHQMKMLWKDEAMQQYFAISSSKG